MTERIENISVDLIDDPDAPMRSQMDEEKLDELARSIKQYGLIQPITLRKNNQRYEVVAGHRRYTATKRAGLPFISAIVRTLTDADTDSMRMHENLYREDINPVDEARYIKIMIDKHQTEPAELAKITGKSEAYLLDRYDLLSYPDYLLQAIEQEHISLSAGKWLHKIKDEPIRKEYTKFAILGGITAKRAESWFRSWELGSLPREANMFQPPEEVGNNEPRELRDRCVLCRNDDNIENMRMYYAHADCAKAVAEMQDKK